MKIDLVFLIVLGFVIAYIFMLHKVESMADVSNTDQIKEAVKQIYLADVEAIRNLSNVATKLQAGGLTVPGNLTTNIINAVDNINVSNKTNEGGRIRILNELKNGKADQTNDWSIWNMTGAYGNKLAFWRYNGDGKNAGPTLELQDNGTVNVGDVVLNTGIKGPNGKTRLSNQGIMFGGPNANRETNSGQISAGLHIANSLNIVGMSGDTGAASRRIDMWAEGGLNVYGSANVNGPVNANGNSIFNGDVSVKGAIATKVNIIYPVKWDRNDWLDRMTPWFSNSEPDGTKREFVLIHPGNFDVNHPNRWIVYFTGIKVGKQIIYFQSHPEHHNIPNPYTSGTNDGSWRRNI